MTRFKICGLTRPEDVRASIELGAHAVGFVHVPHSQRHVSTELLAELTRSAGPLVTRVAVIADLPLPQVLALSETTAMDAIQLHGKEDPAYVAALRHALPHHVALIKALRIHSPADLAQADSYDVQALLVDGEGGGGQPFDWSILAGWVSPRPLIVAGGLTPHNVRDAIARLKPYAVDVASGVEARPGQKDPGLLAAFAAAVFAART